MNGYSTFPLLHSWSLRRFSLILRILVAELQLLYCTSQSTGRKILTALAAEVYNFFACVCVCARVYVCESLVYTCWYSEPTDPWKIFFQKFLQGFLFIDKQIFLSFKIFYADFILSDTDQCCCCLFFFLDILKFFLWKNNNTVINTFYTEVNI